ncbi:MAG TPA: ABC transporter permease subunit [Gaiellaceae bacterium]|nr:ABC transporter permease subunit [Gaiellaceae bacterium]
MAAELARRGLLDHRRALAGWCIGVIGYTSLLASIFPSFKGSPDLQRLVQRYPDALKQLFGIGQGGIGTGAGYLDAELFSLMLPLLVLVLAIGSGARTFAGEEDAGRLELVLSYPLRRRDAVLAKGAALAAEVAIFCVVAFASLAVLSVIAGLDLDTGRLAAGILSLAVLGLFYGWLALAVGAAVPSKVLALGIAAGTAAVDYLVGGLHALAAWLNPFRVLSPFWLVGQSPLQSGVDWWGILVVLGAAAVALVAGALLVERRDLQTP